MMETRRGTTILASDLRKQSDIFAPGDIVLSVMAGSIDFVGQVTRVDAKTHKIFVNWGDGCETQHDPDEIQLSPSQNQDVIDKMLVAKVTRRMRGASVDSRPFVADNSRVATGEMGQHDIEPGGEYSNWAKDIKRAAKYIQRKSRNAIRFKKMKPFDVYQGPYAEMSTGKLWSGQMHGEYILELPGRDFIEGDANEIAEQLRDRVNARSGAASSDFSGLRSRRALYWGGPGRTYRLTKKEQNEGVNVCPRCKQQMEKQKFTRNEKLLVCPECDFKIPSSKVINKKIEIEIEPDGKIEVEIEPIGQEKEASRRSKSAAMGVPSDLNRMKISEIASLISADWSGVNFGAKPYLEAMFSLDTADDMYGMDTGKSIILYFLSNARTWKGDVAKAVKKELKKRSK